MIIVILVPEIMSELVAPAPEHCPGLESEAAGKASGICFRFIVGLEKDYMKVRFVIEL